MSARPVLAHVTTTDISLALLLGPQLRAFAAAGYDVVGVSAPGPHVAELESWGIRHIGLQHATRSMAPHRDLAALVELRGVFRRSYFVGRALRSAGMDRGASFRESVGFLARELGYFISHGHIHRLPQLLPYEFLRWAGFQWGRLTGPGRGASTVGWSASEGRSRG